MKFRFTIGRKIGSGFTLLVLTTLVIFLLTYDTLKTGREISDRITNVYNPSISSLTQLKSTILRSRTLIIMWAYVQSREDTKEKLSLVKIVNEEIPQMKAGIDSLSLQWTDNDRRKSRKIYSELDKLIAMYTEVQSTLGDMKSYDDPMSRFSMTEFAEEDGLIYQQARVVIDELNELINEQRENTIQDSVIMLSQFDTLEGYLKNMSIALFLFGIIIAIFTVRSITKPVFKLKDALIELGNGKFPRDTIVHTGDEIGEMSIAMDNLVSGLKRTTKFANEVGKGDFETEFEPLSGEDVLGNALLVMRDGLKDYEAALRRNEQDLERKVVERTEEVVKQKNWIEKQNEIHKELYENITASIHYAKRLQDNILPSQEYINLVLTESFIHFRPKDIVSGDFYYIKKVGSKVIFAAVDCTGHGVPGAFMSLVGHNAINQAISVNKELDPSKILLDLNRYAANAFSRSKTTDTTDDIKDGMDMALCVYDREAGIVEYAGANNPLYIIRNEKLTTYRPDKIAIGSPSRTNEVFQSHVIHLEENDMIYMFSDGYADQFGGPKGKKFLLEPFRRLLTDVSGDTLDTQQIRIAETMEEWRKGWSKEEEQIDDILIMGVRHKSV